MKTEGKSPVNIVRLHQFPEYYYIPTITEISSKIINEFL